MDVIPSDCAPQRIGAAVHPTQQKRNRLADARHSARPRDGMLRQVTRHQMHPSMISDVSVVLGAEPLAEKGEHLPRDDSPLPASNTAAPQGAKFDPAARSSSPALPIPPTRLLLHLLWQPGTGSCVGIHYDDKAPQSWRRMHRSHSYVLPLCLS